MGAPVSDVMRFDRDGELTPEQQAAWEQQWNDVVSGAVKFALRVRMQPPQVPPQGYTPAGYLPGVAEDGSLQIARLADYQHDNLPTQMEKSVALAQKLFSNGHLGCDVIYMLPYGRFPLHTHPGHHLLLILKGSGTVTYGGRVYETQPGELYFVPGEVEHAVGGGPQGHWLLSIGAPHKPADSEERMAVTEDGMANDQSAALEVAREVRQRLADEGRGAEEHPALQRLLAGVENEALPPAYRAHLAVIVIDPDAPDNGGNAGDGDGDGDGEH